MENNYSVYQHVTPDGMYYFGATQNVERRWSNNGAEYKRTALQPYIEKFGWDNIQHIVLFKDQTRENALWIENFLIETAREDGVCINKQRSGLVSKEEGYKQEYYQQNKQQIREYQQEYCKKNRDEILEQKRDYYQQKRDEILEQKRDYYQQKRDEILEQRRQRYQRKKEEQQRREYQRQYYQRKKEEKQFKELGCLPLW